LVAELFDGFVSMVGRGTKLDSEQSGIWEIGIDNISIFNEMMFLYQILLDSSEMWIIQ
jgi:hypothetical protein